MRYTIGEFSKMTGLTIKAIHLYHEKTILVPAVVDEANGDRLFDDANVERAGGIALLKELQFSLCEIPELMNDYDDDGELLGFLERKRLDLRKRMMQMRRCLPRAARRTLCDPDSPGRLRPAVPVLRADVRVPQGAERAARRAAARGLS
jgi:DNA-binding transcriptional MerR regulator